MRRLLKVVARLVLVVSAIALFAARAEAVTLREIVELTRAGLSDEVLLALIEIDQRVFPVDPDTLKMLKDAGVSPAVIVAIVKSGRTPKSQPEPAPLAEIVHPDPPTPQVVVVEKPVLVEREVVLEVPVAVPVYVAVGRSRGHRADPYLAPASAFVPFGQPPTVDNRSEKRDRSDKDRKAEPVYWGFGGKLRPDAWNAK
jgi:hypothetical protein